MKRLRLRPLLCATVLLGTTLQAPHHNHVLAEWSEPKKLNSNINGGSYERFPFITADNKRLYWCSTSFPEGHGSNEDIYVAMWDSTSEDWGPRQILGEEINTFERELSPCESPDRQYLWFTRWNGSMGYDLYYSRWDTASATWGTAVNAGPQFNSPCVEWSVSISPDGKRMFLAHGIRPGTFGCEGQVMWISYWNDTACWWDTLIWMGEQINSSSEVWSATMSLDTSRLYVADGRSLGDLFSVSNNPLSWDTIVTLGVPPNSPRLEESVAISPDGNLILFTSWRDSTLTRPDIYVSEWLTPTGIQYDSATSSSYRLEPPSPNPFNLVTDVSIRIDVSQRVRLTVHNVLGQSVAVLNDGPLTTGFHTFKWHTGKNASGVYFVYAIGAKGGEQVRKVLLLK